MAVRAEIDIVLIYGINSPSRAHKRGGSRSSRNVGPGMRWTPWRQVLAPGETCTADGEVVWSWRRDPGVKLLVRPMQRRWQERPLHRGEHEAAVKTIARGKSGRSG